MKRAPRNLLGLLFFCVCAGVPDIQAQELVANGSFEAPIVATNTFAQLPSIPGWTVCAGPSIEVNATTGFTQYDGRQFVELDSTASSAICQNVPTQPNGLYVLRFAYSPRPGVLDNRIDVVWDSQLLTQLDASGVGLEDTDWQEFVFFVRASSSTTELRFSDAGVSDTVGGWIDGVSLQQFASPVPVASTGGLMTLSTILWVLGLVARSRRRNRAPR